VLGQLFGDYSDGVVEVLGSRSDHREISLGFLADPDPGADSLHGRRCALLTEAWRAEIEVRCAR
jgi:hypothetical protein